MYSILLVFEKPSTTNYKEQQRWHGLTENMKNLASNNTDIQILGENCLMLPTEKGLDIFYHVLRDSLEVSYKYIILTEEPKWHVVTK